MSAAAMSPAAPPRLPLASRLGSAALWLLLWLSLIRFPGAPGSTLDASWQMILGYAGQHHLQFGSDLVFSYGPLGYLLTGINLGDGFGPHYAWQFLFNAVLATVLWFLGRSLPAWRRAAYYGFLFLFGTFTPEPSSAIVALLLGLALLRDEFGARRTLVAAVAIFLGILALTKVTTLLLVVLVVATVAGCHAFRHRWREAAAVAGFFLVGFLGSWLALRQNPAHLPVYFARAIEVSAGYGEAMGNDEPTLVFLLGLGAGFAVLAAAALSLLRTADPAHKLTAAALVIGATFLMWKQGFVRAGGHLTAHFSFCLFVGLAGPALLARSPRFPRLQSTLLAATGALAFLGLCVSTPIDVVRGLSAWNLRLEEETTALLDLPAWAAHARRQFAEVRDAHALPTTRTLVGTASVDVLGYEQGYAIFNGLNYHPRPVIQSYKAYTESLLRLNEARYLSPGAPGFVLQKIQTIDDRLPAMDDALATRALYRNYRYVTQENGFLLWQRGPALAVSETPSPVASATLAFGQTWTLPDRGETPLWLQIEVRPTLLGRLRTLLYKPPQLRIRVTDADGFTAGHRLVRRMSAAGFLAAPYLPDNDSVVRYFGGAPATRLASISVELPPGDRGYFDAAIAVRVSTLAPFARNADAARAEFEKRFHPFNRLPRSATALYPPGPIDEAGREVLFAHPPSRLEFTLDADSRHVTGQFGLTAKASEPPNHTDGVDFILEWAEPSGRVTSLFHRALRPVEVPADRGPQSFDVTLPAGPGRLLMRTTPGPANDLAFDWAYWTDVKFGR